MIKAVEFVFPDPNIELCTIHIVRSFFKKITELFGKVFFNQSKILKDLWKILQGIFYVESDFLINLITHMRFELLPILPPVQQLNFESFLNYLCKNYFNADALFTPKYWNYFDQIKTTRIIDLTTNPLDRINRKLKDICSTGHISFHKCYRTLHKFKSEYIRDYDFQITGNNPQNRRSTVTKNRHEEILKIFDQWSSFNLDC